MACHDLPVNVREIVITFMNTVCAGNDAWDAQKITKSRTRWIAQCWNTGTSKMIYYKQQLINPVAPKIIFFLIITYK